jgi:hypothetical protein
LPRLERIGGDWLIQNAVIRKITDRAAGGAAGRDRELTAGFHERLIRAPVRAHDHSATVHNHVGNVGAPGLDLVDRVSFADRHAHGGLLMLRILLYAPRGRLLPVTSSCRAVRVRSITIAHRRLGRE